MSVDGPGLYNLFEFLQKYPIEKGKDPIQEGDVCVCWSEDTSMPQDVGTVKHVGRTNLTPQHQDGKVGDVHILSFAKARLNREKPLNRTFLARWF